MKRPELFDFIARARGLGFSPAVTPAGMQALTEETVQRMHRAGVWMMALSLDGSGPETHDSLRGVPGSFARTLQATLWAIAAGLPLQINTLVCRETLHDLPGVYSQLTGIGVGSWALFFLIQVGRGRVLQGVTPEASNPLSPYQPVPRGEGSASKVSA